MPPQRTVPPPKPLKTERTHEENQERAYIAASRRSDRSLEARVESARRASAIHKRRTGRSLRVTEQDVINEEMYEEEDDDLPFHYRRLTAHLQTGSPDFNRRLAAYLTNHVAMRSALDQAITASYAQQYPNAPQFAHNNSIYASPVRGGFGGTDSPTSPGSVQRHAPYPSPGSLSMRNSMHGRSQSIASPQNPNSPNPSLLSGHSRRMSMPQGPVSPSSIHQGPSNVHTDASLDQNFSPFGINPSQDFGPFSTALPVESQMFLGPALDQNDHLTPMLMAGSENLPQFRGSGFMNLPSDGGPKIGGESTSASFELDFDNLGKDSKTSGPDSTSKADQNQTLAGLAEEPSSFETTDPLDLETDWTSFIDDNSWEQNAT